MSKSDYEPGSYTRTTDLLVLRNYDEEILHPIGPVAIISDQLDPALSDSINFHLRNRRAITVDEYPNQGSIPGYFRADYRIPAILDRFNSGEGKAIITESVRGHDLFIITDVLNYGQRYQRFEQDVSLSPDEHFEDLSRVISAVHGVAKRINVIMPYLYEGRVYRRVNRGSLDCAVMLNRLFDLGIDNFLTFDAHDDRMANAVPTKNFESVKTSLQLIEALITEYPDLKIDKDNFMVASADEASIKRCIYYASLMQVPLGLFYRHYDPRLISEGKYTERSVKSHAQKKFLGDQIAGKDVLIVDDMIDTGKTALECATQLKEQNARRVFVAVTFAQFSKGIEKFDEAYEKGIINKIFATNLAYRPPELLEREWFSDVNFAKYIALLIDGYNHDASLSSLMNPTKRIQELLNNFKGVTNGKK
ncbi:MAG: ribose-phosphate diphosphokinase [Clostridiaceae bacterium]|nr:ribose-phosphate diphosphokinase [Clostridiaceae bacterium]